MIFDNIKNKENYRLLPDLYTVLCHMESTSVLPDAPIVIDDKRVFINPVSFTSRDKSECLYEAHRKYIDVHYILSGAEAVCVTDLSLLTNSVAYDEQKDIGFHDGIASCSLALNPGDFLVCFANDAHKVSMAVDLPAPITKLVGKIAL